MNGERQTRKSLWEHAGYPGVPNYHQEQSTSDVDAVFKERLARLHNGRAETRERVEAVLAWTTLRDEELRETLRYYYDYEVLNQATNLEAGPAELLEYHEQVERIRREAAADAEAHRAEGGSDKSAEWMEAYTLKRRHDAETYLRKPALPGAAETWAPRHPVLKALGWGAAWTGLTAGLSALALVLNVSGSVAGVLAGIPWLTVTLAVVATLGLAYVIHGWYDYRPISWNKWLSADKRGNWPLLVWCLVAASVGIAAPLWVTAVWIPLSAGLPLLNGRFRRRIRESVGGVEGPMLELQELAGRPARHSSNVFVPANSTIQAEGPALAVAMPMRTRDGSAGHSVAGCQETLLSLAEHASVESSGLAVDVHKVAAALVLDAVVGSTGADDLRLVAQYGSGPMELTARAITIGLGQEVLEDPEPGCDRPGRAVAPWFQEEAEAYRQFVDKHLCAADADLALASAAQILRESSGSDFPHLVRYRLETLCYALSASASWPSSASSA